MRGKGLVGIGTIAVDRIRRVPRVVPADAKGRASAVEILPGGATVNHLAWSACLGAPSSFLGVVGRDAEARFMLDAMDAAGIGRGDVEAGDGATAVSEIFVEPGGERAIYMDFGRTARVTPAQVRRLWASPLRKAAFVSTDLSQMPLVAAEAALRLAGGRVVVDLDVPPSLLTGSGGRGTKAELSRILGLADVLKPTLAAAAEVTGRTDALEAAKALALRGHPVVVVTDGARGAALAMGRKAWRVPAFRIRSAVDATGAGDAFLGGFLAGLSFGLSPLESARLGSACGSVCVETLGAFPPPDAWERVKARFGGGLKRPAKVSASSEPPGRKVLAAAAKALADTAASVDSSEATALLLSRLRAGGRLHCAGVGKAAFVAARVAATMTSWGIPAQPLDVAASAHGDLGQVGPKDAVLAVSKSGETEELLSLVRMLRVPVVAVTGGANSRLARAASVALCHPVVEEGGPFNLAPMASLACEAALLDALCAELASALGRTPRDFAGNHPGGALGRRAARLAGR